MQTPILRIIMLICMVAAALASLYAAFSLQLLVAIAAMGGLFIAQVFSPSEKSIKFKIIFSSLSGLAMGLWGFSMQGFLYFGLFTLTVAAVPGGMFGFQYGIIAVFTSLLYYFPALTQSNNIYNFTNLIILLAFATGAASIGGRNLRQVVQESEKKDDLNFLLEYNNSIAHCESESELAEKTFDIFLNRFIVRVGVVVAGQGDAITLLPARDNPLVSLDSNICQSMLNTIAWEAFQADTALRIENPGASPLIPARARDALHDLSLYPASPNKYTNDRLKPLKIKDFL